MKKIRLRHTNGTDLSRLFSAKLLGGGRYVMNAIDGVACTLAGAHHYAGNITHPRQGFREMGVLEIVNVKSGNSE